MYLAAKYFAGFANKNKKHSILVLKNDKKCVLIINI